MPDEAFLTPKDVEDQVGPDGETYKVRFWLRIDSTDASLWFFWVGMGTKRHGRCFGLV